MPAHSDRPARRTVAQRLLIVTNVAAMCFFLVAAGVLAYSYGKYGRIPRVQIGESLAGSQRADGRGIAENFLIVGVDSADGLDPDDPVAKSRARIGGIRSDTMMILRVDPTSTRAALLSLPRDLWVPLPDGGGMNRLNAAVQIGGPELLLETVQEYLGIPVNHYVQVDFYGFGRLVETIDGVPVHFPNPVRDRQSGLDVPESGCITLDKVNALGFVRSRAYQEFVDGRWRTDGTGDLGRIHRQQLFIMAALDRAFERGLRNPVTLDALVDSALEAVTIDDTLDGDDLIDLALQFRKFEPSNLDLYDLPVGSASVGGLSVLQMQARAAEDVLGVFRDIDPATIDPSSVRVRVLNGTGTPGEAAAASAALRSAGFALGGTGDSRRLGLARTEVRYPPGLEHSADLVARWSRGPIRRVRDAAVDVVTLVTGDDWDGLRSRPRPPRSTTTTTLARTTTVPDRSTTSVVGTIPTAIPPGVSCG